MNYTTPDDMTLVHLGTILRSLSARMTARHADGSWRVTMHRGERITEHVHPTILGAVSDAIGSSHGNHD